MSSLEPLLDSPCGRCPVEGKPLLSTCPGPHACCTCASPPLPAQMVSARPAQLPPHASAAPRTGPCRNPAGRGASKPGSSWDAWGHQGWGWGWFLSWRPSASIYTHVGPGCLGLRGQEAGSEEPKTGEPQWLSFNPTVSHKVPLSPFPCACSPLI